MKRIFRAARLLILLLLAIQPAQAVAAAWVCEDGRGSSRVQAYPCDDFREESVDAPAADREQRHFLWAVRAEGATVWLVGSIHYGSAAMYPLPAAMRRAFAAATTLAVEADITNADIGGLRELLDTRGRYPPGERLQDHLSPATRERLDAAVDKVGVYRGLIERQRPWLAAMVLETAAARREGFREEAGVDRYFLNRRGSRELVQLESLRWQVEMLAGLPEPAQLRLLEQALDSVEQAETLYPELVRAWRGGDSAAIERLSLGSLRRDGGGETLYAALFAQRNAAMADGVVALLEQPGEAFMVVGAAHLVGADGVVERLRRRGYVVEQH